MELWAADQRASFNPFTSLISFEPGGEESIVVPIVDYPFPEYSTIFHELTHLWCARSSRLGWFLTGAAADAVLTWRHGGGTHASLPENVWQLLWAYTPILEGLAMYAQLDYQAETNDDSLPSPVFLFTDLTNHRLAYNMQLDKLLEMIREEAISQRKDQGRGLLELLFLGSERPDLIFYLPGYLYIKALQQLLARRSSAFSRPAIFLPFIIKLICDHPLIIKCARQSVVVRDILNELHQTITNISYDRLKTVSAWIAKHQSIEANFDHWDFYATDEGQAPVSFTLESVAPFFDPDSQGEKAELIPQLRQSASVHVLHQIEGILQSVTSQSIVVKRGDEEVDIRIIDATYRVNFFAFSPDGSKTKYAEDDFSQTAKWEYNALGLLAQHIGQQVNVGKFFSLTRGTFGMVFWAQNELISFIPFEPIEFIVRTNENELYTLLHGLRIAPTERLAFARSLAVPEQQGESLRLASSVVWEKLISNPRKRQLLLTHALENLELGRHTDKIREWCYPPLFRRGPALMAEEVVQAASKVFDFPGFSPTEQIGFNELLPPLNLVA
jgi:hypothetical protein